MDIDVLHKHGYDGKVRFPWIVAMHRYEYSYLAPKDGSKAWRKLGKMLGYG